LNDEAMRLNWISYMAIAGLAMWLGCASANATSANDVLAACKLYLSVIHRHGAVSQSEIPHLMDAGECLGAVYALLSVSHTLPEPLKFCPPVEFEAEQGVRAVVAFIEKKPERGREDFTTIALEALRSKWPCR
jgi:hypothetical protein